MLLGFSIASAEEAASPAAASETKGKPVVATIYINNAKSTYDDEILKRLADRFKR